MMNTALSCINASNSMQAHIPSGHLNTYYFFLRLKKENSHGRKRLFNKGVHLIKQLFEFHMNELNSLAHIHIVLYFCYGTENPILTCC